VQLHPTQKSCTLQSQIKIIWKILRNHLKQSANGLFPVHPDKRRNNHEIPLPILLQGLQRVHRFLERDAQPLLHVLPEGRLPWDRRTRPLLVDAQRQQCLEWPQPADAAEQRADVVESDPHQHTGEILFEDPDEGSVQVTGGLRSVECGGGLPAPAAVVDAGRAPLEQADFSGFDSEVFYSDVGWGRLQGGWQNEF